MSRAKAVLIPWPNTSIIHWFLIQNYYYYKWAIWTYQHAPNRILCRAADLSRRLVTWFRNGRLVRFQSKSRATSDGVGQKLGNDGMILNRLLPKNQLQPKAATKSVAYEKRSKKSYRWMNELRLGLSIGRFFQQSASEKNHPLCYWPPLTTYSRRSVLSFKFSVLTLLRSLHEHWAKNARSENFQLYLCAMLEYVSIKVLQSRFLVFLVWPRCSTWLTESLEKSRWFQQAENLFKFARFDDIYCSLWTLGFLPRFTVVI